MQLKFILKVVVKTYYTNRRLATINIILTLQGDLAQVHRSTNSGQKSKPKIYYGPTCDGRTLGLVGPLGCTPRPPEKQLPQPDLRNVTMQALGQSERSSLVVAFIPKLS